MPARKQKEEMPEHVREQVERLGHHTESMRIEAAQALANMAHPAAVPHLVKALRDPEWYVRNRAAYALGEIGHPSALKPLTRLLQDLMESNRKATVSALTKISRAVSKKRAETKAEKALLLVWPHFRGDEKPETMHKALTAAFSGKITEKNARLFVKQLRAVEGSVK